MASIRAATAAGRGAEDFRVDFLAVRARPSRRLMHSYLHEHCLHQYIERCLDLLVLR